MKNFQFRYLMADRGSLRLARRQREVDRVGVQAQGTSGDGIWRIYHAVGLGVGGRYFLVMRGY